MERIFLVLCAIHAPLKTKPYKSYQITIDNDCFKKENDF